jgi:hypothetical protein
MLTCRKHSVHGGQAQQVFVEVIVLHSAPQKPPGGDLAGVEHTS